MDIQFANLNEDLPDGFFMQRHRPLVMPETHSHGHVEVLLPVGCNLTYLTQTGPYSAQDGKMSVLWGHIPHRVTEIDGDGEILIANLPLAELLSWSMPEAFLTDLFRGRMVTATHSDPLDRLQFQRWTDDFASGDTKSIAVSRMEIQLSLRRQSLSGWNVYKVLDKEFPKMASSGDQSQVINSRQSDRVLSMVRFIAEHFTQPINTTDIAHAAGISKGHAMGIFKKMLGVNINRFLTQLRLHHAKSALENTDDKILTIALDSGFGSLSRFYEVFSSETGHAPQYFRKMQHQARQ